MSAMCRHHGVWHLAGGAGCAQPRSAGQGFPGQRGLCLCLCGCGGLPRHRPPPGLNRRCRSVWILHRRSVMSSCSSLLLQLMPNVVTRRKSVGDAFAAVRSHEPCMCLCTLCWADVRGKKTGGPGHREQHFNASPSLIVLLCLQLPWRYGDGRVC